MQGGRAMLSSDACWPVSLRSRSGIENDLEEATGPVFHKKILLANLCTYAGVTRERGGLVAWESQPPRLWPLSRIPFRASFWSQFGGLVGLWASGTCLTVVFRKGYTLLEQERRNELQTHSSALLKPQALLVPHRLPSLCHVV